MVTVRSHTSLSSLSLSRSWNHEPNKTGEAMSKKEQLYKAFEVFDPKFVMQIRESEFMEVFADKTLELDCDANEFKELLAHTGLQGYSTKKIVDYQKLIDYLLTEDSQFE